MIIKNVPFVDDKKQNYASCQGPPTIMMVFKYFNPSQKMSFHELYKKMNYKRKTWFFEVYIARFFNQQGIPVTYYSNVQIKKIGKNAKYFKELSGLNLNNEREKNEYGAESYDAAVKYVLSNKLFQKRKFSTVFIKEKLNQNKLVIATINRNIITKKEGYRGHFILVKGFNKKGFICNDAYLGENILVNFEKFKEAFHSPDSDIVVIG